jgi:hypothetical protein
MATVRVRIAVAVDPSGKWNAVGYTKDGDANNLLSDEDMESACEFVSGGEARYWITATLAVPEVIAVEGDVQQAEAYDALRRELKE